MSNNSNYNPKIGLLNYYLTEDELLIFLIKKDFNEPLVYRTKINDEKYKTQEYLNLCAQRLIIDFNGLDPEWRKNSFLSDLDSKRIEDSLNLEPIVRESWRYRDPNYPGSILKKDNKVKFYKFKQNYLDKISEIVFPEKLKMDIKDCDLLCISPHSVLHSIPFHALKWNNENIYIIEKFGICYIPSFSTLKYCQIKNSLRNNPGYKLDNCLVICSGKEDDHLKFEEDIKFMEESYKWNSLNILKGSESTKSNVMNNLQNENRDIIHFSTHGLFGIDYNQDPLESGLLLSSEAGFVESADVIQKDSPESRLKYLLTAREIFNISLNANLVTLRACSSGRASIKSGDELIGLTRALLYAGTPSLIVSLWNVNIASSKNLLSEFYRLWLDKKNSLPKWNALQQAQVSFIKRMDDKYSHPYHWAPFVLIGDWL